MHILLPLMIWVIEFGASDHITSMSHSFLPYNPCAGRDKVRITDDSMSPVLGKGSVCHPLYDLVICPSWS
jgi:hypothetical protein